MEEMLKEFARRMGADLVGLASAWRLEGAPDGSRPGDSLEGARTVIILGKTLPRGVMLGKKRTNYHQFMNSTFIQLEQLASEVARFIEAAGGRYPCRLTYPTTSGTRDGNTAGAIYPTSTPPRRQGWG